MGNSIRNLTFSRSARFLLNVFYLNFVGRIGLYVHNALIKKKESRVKKKEEWHLSYHQILNRNDVYPKF